MSSTFDDVVQKRGVEDQDAGAVKPKRRPPPPIQKRSDAEVEAILAGEIRPLQGKSGNRELHKLSPNWRKAEAKRQAEALAGSGVIPGTDPQTAIAQGGELVAQSLTPKASDPDIGTGQFLARQGVSLARILEHAPDAVDYLGKVVRGRVKVPAGLRLQACFKVLDAGGINAQVGERIEAALRQPGGASLQSLAARLIEASELAKKRQEIGQTSGTPQPQQGDSPL